MVSMKDIALKCGVSVATVSKALNGYSDIGDETRSQIKQAAAELGYFPNSAARALKTNRTYNIGVLFVDEARSGLTHEYFASVLDNFKVNVEKRGYDVTFINHHIGTRAMSYYEHCRYRGVDGVVIACVNFDEPEVVELINSDIPVVTIDHIFNNRTAIISDNIAGMRDLVTYIHSMGHRKIAYIHGADSSVTRDRVTSFYRTMEELQIEIPESYVQEGIYHDTESAASRTRELLALKSRPTCIIYPDDFACIGGINEIKEQGLHIPDDISVVGYDGLHFTQVLEPKLTTLKQDTYLLGKEAADHLISLIERPKTTLITRAVVKGKLLSGNSVSRLSH
ncbi:LacI family transcriptional regulator [Mobilisporobacter senegalensis]|uniref:LacI family transcriptional regulator n=1 Tax=Mobilisporobacter senegalensis TaxID=1329262 RepID=A0A3N1XRL4_9FIRM|nr:LacI family DNA-binding transcriptional regulator [Mobilisporobacter senegalensis]ROR29309.1 LacI family transcriptional regulator [Mobilisporobacter senegalensis]